jgi:hypothetical protein
VEQVMGFGAVEHHAAAGDRMWGEEAFGHGIRAIGCQLSAVGCGRELFG